MKPPPSSPRPLFLPSLPGLFAPPCVFSAIRWTAAQQTLPPPWLQSDLRCTQVTNTTELSPPQVECWHAVTPVTAVFLQWLLHWNGWRTLQMLLKNTANKCECASNAFIILTTWAFKDNFKHFQVLVLLQLNIPLFATYRWTHDSLDFKAWKKQPWHFTTNN